MSGHSVPDGNAPYKGTRAFDFADQSIFFGRSRETSEVRSRWTGSRLTVLYGPAGVGKTSLLRAGVVPALRDAGAHVPLVGHAAHRLAFPMAALPEYNPFTLAVLSTWYDGESPVRIAEFTITDVLRRHGRTDRFGQPVATLAAIDQAERLLRDSGRHERHRLRFLDDLAAAMAKLPDLHLLLVAREEDLDGVLALAGRLGLPEPATCALGPLDPDAAIAAVEGPLRRCGRRDGRIGRLLVRELRTVRLPGGSRAQTSAFVDPALLQIVCSGLTADLLDDSDAPAEQVRQEVDRVLAEFCAQTLAAIAADHSLPVKTVLSWFRSVFGGTRGRAGIPESPSLFEGVSEAVVRAAEDSHLIKVRVRDGVRCYEVQHPRLVEPIGRFGDQVTPIRRPPSPERLRQAELAFADGDLSLARRHVQAAARTCSPDDLRLRAEAASFLGNIAYEQGDTAAVIERYREAAGIYEAVPDNAAVGWLLAGIGRLLLNGHPAESARELRAAADRLPHEQSIQEALGQALVQSGRTHAGSAVLDSARPRR